MNTNELKIPPDESIGQQVDHAPLKFLVRYQNVAVTFILNEEAELGSILF